MRQPLRIGTRGSQLALWQARAVAERLEAAHVDTDIVVIRTAGDRLQEAPLTEIGGKRLFVKEIEDALLRGEIDAAVHSAKDMPASLPDGLAIAATLPRADPRDALVLPAGRHSGHLPAVLSQLDEAPRVGTSSIRRSAQLRALFGRGVFSAIRGNVDTRLRKLDAGEYDVLVLACAGMQRLGFAERISAPIPVDVCVPAPGQGIVAVEIRTDDDATRRALAAVNDPEAETALAAEREVVAALGGGCQLPLGAVAVFENGALHVHAVVCSTDGLQTIRAHSSGPADAAIALGREAAAILAQQGASRILDAVRQAQGPVEGSP